MQSNRALCHWWFCKVPAWKPVLLSLSVRLRMDNRGLHGCGKFHSPHETCEIVPPQTVAIVRCTLRNAESCNNCCRCWIVVKTVAISLALPPTTLNVHPWPLETSFPLRAQQSQCAVSSRVWWARTTGVMEQLVEGDVPAGTHGTVGPSARFCGPVH